MLAIGASLAAVAVLVGWLVANGHTKYAAVILVPVPVFVIAFTARASAPLAGVLVLLVMNGIPIVNLGGRLPGGIHVQDVAVIALALVLYLYRDTSPEARSAPYARAVRVWSACLLAWWAFTVARSVLIESVSVRDAVLYGRDFLYFAILLPLALGARLPAKSVRIAAVVVVGGTAVYAAGYAFAGLTGVTLSWLVHPGIVADVIGQTRFYSPMNYVVDSAAIFASALVFSKNSPGNRWVTGGLFILFVLAAALGLTRANYFGLIIAVVAIAVVYAMRHGSVTAVAARLAVIVLVAGAGIGLFTAVVGHSGNLTGNPVVSRVSTGVSDITNSTGTFGYRKELYNTLLTALGSQWPIGLGFLHPGSHPVANVPSGSIRNADTGALAVLMTMGLVGVFLIYAPPIYAFRKLLLVSRRSESTSHPLPRWILYGGAGFLAWAVAGSVTLGALSSTPGLVLTTLVLTALGWAIRAATSSSSPEASSAGGTETRLETGGLGRIRPTAGANSYASVAASANGTSVVHPALVADRVPAARRGRALNGGSVAERAPIGQGAPTRNGSSVADAVRPSPGSVAQVATQVTVVVVTYNSAHCIRACIKRLRVALGDCEIVIVDNLSTDDTVSIATETDNRVRVISMGRNAGYGSACNRGVVESANGHVLLMNPDVVLEHADLEKLRMMFPVAPFGLVAPGLRTDNETVAHPQTFPRSTWRGELSVLALGPFRPRGLPRRSRLAESGSAAWASGALLMVRRSEFLQLGGFDERFFLYYEDQELGLRYRNAGLPVRGTDLVRGAHSGGKSAVERSDDGRIGPMAWCVLAWLELVAMQQGRRRAKLSWIAIRTSYRVGGRLVERAGALTGLRRLQRKAEQLESIDTAVTQIARAGVNSEHPYCPVACRLVSGSAKRDEAGAART